MGKSKKTAQRWPKGYLAGVLAKVKANKKSFGGTFRDATWRIVFFEEAKRNTLRARAIEKAMLDHMKRQSAKGEETSEERSSEDTPSSFTSMHQYVAQTPGQKALQKMLRIPYWKIHMEALAHERAMYPYGSSEN